MTGSTSTRCRRLRGLALIGAVGVAMVLVIVGRSPGADASPSRVMAASNYHFSQVKIDTSQHPMVISGLVTYDTIFTGSKPITSVRAHLSPMPAECGVPSDLYAYVPARSTDDGTLSSGRFTFVVSPDCTVDFSVTFFALTATSGLDGQGVSITYIDNHYEPPAAPPPTTEPTTTTTTSTTTTQPGAPHPGGGPGTPGTAPSTVPGAKPPTGGGGGSVHGGLSTAPKSPVAIIPGLPGIRGSAIQQVNPSIAQGPPDTYSPTLNYPDQPAMAQGKSKQNLAGDDGPTTKRLLNTRLIAGCAGGAMVAGLFAAQIVLLNRRGRELDDTLPRIG